MTGSLGTFVVENTSKQISRKLPGSSWTIATLLLGSTVFLLPLNVLRVGGVAWADLLVFLVLCAAVVAAIWRKLPRNIIPNWLLVACALLVLSILLLVVFPPGDWTQSFQESVSTGDPYSSSLVVGARLVLALILFPIAISALIFDSRQVQLLAKLWLAGVSVSCAVAVVDFLFGTHVQVALAIRPEMVEPFVEGQFGLPRRQVGLADHPNAFGAMAAMAAPVAIIGMRSLRGALVYGPVLALLALGVGFSGSRAAVMGFIVAALCTLWISRHQIVTSLRSAWVGTGAGVKRTLGVAVVAIALIISLFFFFGGGLDKTTDKVGQIAIIERTTSEQDRSSQVSNSVRRERIDWSLDVISQRPVLGIGFHWVEIPHNIVLAMLVSGGVAALLGFVLAIAGYIRESIRLLARYVDAERTLVAALLGSMACLVVICLLGNHSINRYLYIPMGLAMGLRLLTLIGNRETTRET